MLDEKTKKSLIDGAEKSHCCFHEKVNSFTSTLSSEEFNELLDCSSDTEKEVLDKAKLIEDRREKEKARKALSYASKRSHENKILEDAGRIKEKEESGQPITEEDRKVLDEVKLIVGQREKTRARHSRWYSSKNKREDETLEEAGRIKAKEERGQPITEEDRKVLDEAKLIEGRRAKRKAQRASAAATARKRNLENKILEEAGRIKEKEESGQPISEENRKV